MFEERSTLGEPSLAISVVIFAYCAASTILEVLEALAKQEFDECFEVILATSGSDSTAELVRQRFPEVRVFESPTRLFAGGARNLGASKARGEIIAFLEADMVPRPGWIKNRVRAHRDGHEAVAGALGIRPSDTTASRSTTYLVFGHRLERSVSGPSTRLRAFGLSFTRDLLDRAGPFDESLQINEDTEVAQRSIELGVVPWFEPSICAEHIGPHTLRDLLADQFVRGRREAQSALVREAPGELRTRFQSKPKMAALSVVLRTVRHSVHRSRFLGASLNRYAVDRRDVIKTLPWMAPGFVANSIGWGHEQWAFLGGGGSGSHLSVRPVYSPLRSRVATDADRVVALTFDDGPSAHTGEVMEVLAGYGVAATFFVIGERAEQMPDVVRALVAAGHVVGIHGWTHRPFTELTGTDLENEICRCVSQMAALTSDECRHARPPMGLYDGYVVTALEERKLVTWLWTVDPRDWEATAEDALIARHTLRSATPGGVVLLHDGGGDRSATVRALPAIIEGLIASNYRLVTLDHVIEASGAEVSSSGCGVVARQ
jgi:peptidoglycan-N-acetylglucosamine deacetylase